MENCASLISQKIKKDLEAISVQASSWALCCDELSLSLLTAWYWLTFWWDRVKQLWQKRDKGEKQNKIEEHWRKACSVQHPSGSLEIGRIRIGWRGKEWFSHPWSSQKGGSFVLQNGGRGCGWCSNQLALWATATEPGFLEVCVSIGGSSTLQASWNDKYRHAEMLFK